MDEYVPSEYLVEGERYDADKDESYIKHGRFDTPTDAVDYAVLIEKQGFSTVIVDSKYGRRKDMEWLRDAKLYFEKIRPVMDPDDYQEIAPFH